MSHGRMIAAAVTAAITFTLFTLGCSAGRDPLSPDSAGYPGITGQLQTTTRGADLLAGFTLMLDARALSGQIAPHRTNAGQPPQGQRYDLDIANFQNANSLRISGIEVVEEGNFAITITHAHPFPAPNVSNPATGTNRADLGYTGRLLFLTSYNPQPFFSNEVRLSVGAVLSPDGYVETGDLLASRKLAIVNAYPYILLADEAKNNRSGVSNGGQPQGNYSGAFGGWQRPNLGAGGNGWTGYDYVHGGQTISNTFVLSRSMLEASNFTLDLALLIQYTDPRGAGGSTYRLPPTEIDALKFAYRLPYAALDCSQAALAGPLSLDGTTGATVSVQLRVRDWDAQATEAADNKVGDKADVTLIQQGGRGAPQVHLDAPALRTGAPLSLGAPAGGTGTSAAPLIYNGTLENQQDVRTGRVPVCFRIVDPEAGDSSRGTYHMGVDAVTLLPDAARAVPARTWQVAEVTIAEIPPVPDPPVIQLVTPTGAVGVLDDFVRFSAVIQNEPDTVSWDFGGGTTEPAASGHTVDVRLGSLQGLFTGTVTASNAAGEAAPYTFTYRVLPPVRPPFTRQDFGPVNYSAGYPERGLVQVLDGRPTLFFTHFDQGLGAAVIRVAHGLVADPQGPADWSVYNIPGASNVGTISGGQVNGRLAVSFYQAAVSPPALNQLRYARATTATPASAGDWNLTTIRQSADFDTLLGVRQALVEYAGRPALVVNELPTISYFYLRSSAANPTGPGSWTSHLLANYESSGDGPFDMCLSSGPNGVRPLITLSHGNVLQLMTPSVAEPANQSDWNLQPEQLLPLQVMSIGSIGGNSSQPNLTYLFVAIANGSLLCRRYRWDSDPLTLDEIFLFSGVAAYPFARSEPVWLNNRLAIIIADYNIGSNLVLRALVPTPGATDWDMAALQGYGQRTGIAASDDALLVLTSGGVVSGGIDLSWGYFRSQSSW